MNPRQLAEKAFTDGATAYLQDRDRTVVLGNPPLPFAAPFLESVTKAIDTATRAGSQASATCPECKLNFPILDSTRWYPCPCGYSWGFQPKAVQRLVAEEQTRVARIVERTLDEADNQQRAGEGVSIFDLNNKVLNMIREK